MRFCLTDKKKEGTLPSAWVVQIVKEICHFVGLSCEGFEEELLPLFAVIEASTLSKSWPLARIWEKKITAH